MQTRPIKILALFISCFVLISLSCITTTPDPTATPLPPTDPPLPTPTTEVIVPPTPTTEVIVPPTPTTEFVLPTEDPIETEAVITEEVPAAYFIEEFEGSLDSWSYFVMNGDESKMDLYAENGRLVFDLRGTYQYLYVLYDEYTYQDVRIDVYAENRGKNTNNVSLICNYTDRDGWYEFNISNGGLYDILIYDEVSDAYQILESGGSVHVNMGRADNVYTAICQGNRLALYINGVLEKELVDKKYNLREGQVGLSVSSFNIPGVLVEIDFFSISVP